MKASQKVLMCPPDFFGVSYVINPWMEGHLADTDRALASLQWKRLREAIEQQAEVVLQKPEPGLPDLVFTANAGIVRGKKVIVSRFRNKERQGEEPYDRHWFEEQGFEIVAWPQEVAFEGAGDALFDREKDVLWFGQGFRSDIKAPSLVERFLGCTSVVLHLIDPRFYHLDTCLCPLPGGYVLYYPGAFDGASCAMIMDHVQRDKLIEVSEADALLFCCNAVDLGDRIFMNGASEILQSRLRAAGFTPVITPLSEFMKAGGAAKCLTLKLIEP